MCGERDFKLGCVSSIVGFWGFGLVALPPPSKSARCSGDWKEVFTGNATNPEGAVEAEADISKPRGVGAATSVATVEHSLGSPHRREERSDLAF